MIILFEENQLKLAMSLHEIYFFYHSDFSQEI